MAAIDVSGLTKTYGDLRANDDLSFSVREGEVFGYLGPNGAGKTTTIRTLLGLQSPTAGTATVLGHDVREEDDLIAAKRRTGYLPAHPTFDEHVTGRAVLDLHASLKGDSRRERLLDLFEPPLDREIREYSTGNVQKLGLVQAFMHDPDLVVLDEPTSGLDPLLQERFNEFVRDERDRGTTVFLSSHVLSEVRRVCDRVGILREGRLVTVESVEELLDRSGKVVRVRLDGAVPRDDFRFAGVHDLARRTERGATSFTFTYTGSFDELVDRLADHDVRDLDVEEAPLEDVFLTFYGDDEAGERDTDENSADAGETARNDANERSRTSGADGAGGADA